MNEWIESKIGEEAQEEDWESEDERADVEVDADVNEKCKGRLDPCKVVVFWEIWTQKSQDKNIRLA